MPVPGRNYFGKVFITVKIKVKEMPYEKVMRLPAMKHKRPMKPGILFRTLVSLVSAKDLKDTDFTYKDGERPLAKAGDGPCLILMNHSSFIDLEIVSKIFYPKPYCIVCTSDGFVGKSWLMRRLGCIPTDKFVTDSVLISDIEYALNDLKTSVLMYPEASYSFDGTETPLPRMLGLLLKKLGVPVVMIKTEGAFTRDPLYNGLRKRKVRVSATVGCLLTKKEIAEKTVGELDSILDEAFSYDHFAWQYDNGVEINEPFRAEGLSRILYRCASCGAEGGMESSGEYITCRKCGKKYRLTPLGRLEADDGVTEFPHIPDWYRWEREQVRRELDEGTYKLDIPVKIGMMVDDKAIYMVGSGRLVHDETGFTLTGCDGKLEYRQKPLSSYGLYADYYWYEIGDMICIGTKGRLFYCFPDKNTDVVAKARMAAEELYKLRRSRIRQTAK